MTTARYYTHHAADPFFNMAFDEWLFSLAAAQPGFVAVRLYTWLPGAITFGVNQSEDRAFDSSKLGDTPAIRRVTGGRALYHDPSELTYAVVANTAKDGPASLAGSLTSSSRAIGEALAQFVEASGLHAQFLRRSHGESADREFFHGAPCFVSAARHEVLSDRGKVVASAQRKLDFGFLQHGSIKLDGIAPHPALPGVGQAVASSQLPPSMSAAQFVDHAARFAAVVGPALGLALEPYATTPQEDTELKRITEQLKKNCRTRRYSIEQMPPRASL